MHPGIMYLRIIFEVELCNKQSIQYKYNNLDELALIIHKCFLHLRGRRYGRGKKQIRIQ